MSRFEIYSPEGLRVDGRRWNELRRFECRINTHPNSCDGSSYVEQGNSKVICMIDGPTEPTNRSQSSTTKAVLNINLNVTPFSGYDRKKRLKGERRIQEMLISLKRTFEQSILVEKYPRTAINISVHVLQLDGSLLASVTNAITLALIDAGISMYDYISSVSAGFFEDTPLLDLNSLEEADISSLTIGVVGKSEKLALLILENKIPLDNLETILSIAIAGGHRVRDMMDKEVRKHGDLRLSKLANK